MAKEKKPLAVIAEDERILGGSSKYINEKRILKPNAPVQEKAAYDYCKEVDKAVGQEMSPHRSLRTCLDPLSTEWQETTSEEKLDIMRKLVASGADINRIIKEYKRTFKAMNKMHVVYGVEDGLLALLKMAVKEKK